MKLLLLFEPPKTPFLVLKIISPKVRGDSFASRVYTLLKNAAVVTEFVEKYTALVVVIGQLHHQFRLTPSTHQLKPFHYHQYVQIHKLPKQKGSIYQCFDKLAPLQWS